jgi:hypothetical protein
LTMQEENQPRDPATDLPSGHELSDLRAGPIALFGIGVVIALVLAVAITTFLMHVRAVGQRETPTPRLARERATLSQPRLQVGGVNELREMRAGEEAALNSYGWVDQNAGIVRIPIDRAMEILAAKGLPARKQEEKAR